jgi:hypothetical protein
MSKAHTRGAQYRGCVGSGSTSAAGAAGWLSLAAAPVFALMALWTGLFGQADVLCLSMRDASLDGMVLMYTLMSIFHAAPWIKLIASRRNAARGSPSVICPSERSAAT